VDASDWQWVWVGVALTFVVVELVTPVLFFAISFAAGAALAALAALLDTSNGVQWGVFVVGSIAALFLLVPIGRRIANAKTDAAPEGASRWVGRVAVVLEEIPGGANATGLVRLERAQWRAETEGAAAIPVGAEVEVLSVRGTRLVVALAHAPRADTGAAEPGA
jgi:membrane protein implicated in regulation of membrane protease activity